MARRVRPFGRPAPLAPLPDATFRRLLVVSLVVGSNLPDVDLLYTSFAGGPLGYVLQHRGYTHTLVGALAGALLLWLTGLLWLRWRRLRASRVEQAWVAAACVIGVLLHLAMDYTNSYGVHPFWPFYDGWVYGDSVFILEPLLWLAAVPLIFLLTSSWARVLVALAVGAMTLAVSALGLVATPAAIAFVLLAMAMLAAGRWLRPPVALGCGIGLWLGVTMLFAVCGRVAAQRLDVAAAREFPDSRTLDRVLTPTPANPACWDAWLVQAQGTSETMRQARISLLPGLIAVEACRGADLVRRGQPLSVLPGGLGLQWLEQYTVPDTYIAQLARLHCRARAFMQFARVPMAQSAESGIWLGDLRFGSGRGFSWLLLQTPSETCDFPAVPWLPPRPELLAPAGRGG
ncbi:MAG TPA: metal-dependent hydrolase [Steroidobacteraceae bacterium]|nr:metal-dependent hydrolase [Steroidobacteraceae bacterium]